MCDRLNPIRSVLFPFMMPYAISVLLGIGMYINLTGQNHTGNLISGIGVAIPFVTIAIWLKAEAMFETRADDFAVQSLGFSSVINALQQLNQMKDTIEGMYSGHLNSPFSKRIERIIQKWGKN